PEARRISSLAWPWISIGDFRVPFGLLLDPLTAALALLITGVGGLIHVYSIGYMRGDARVVRYFAFLNLFVAMMLVLVMANNMLLLFLGWEGVGLCSFLLIGHWFERRSAGEAAVKAFVVNRVGDAAFILAMLAIYDSFGTLNFYAVEVARQVQAGFLERVGEITQRSFGPNWQPIPLVAGITFLLLIGATGKSAQLPLFVWLPDAMAGPTPVSALIHAATMVTGGVYLMARAEALFQLAQGVQGWVLWLGVLTALIGATAAIAQWDIKRVLAYSTISQLGFMVAACGVGAYGAAIFHLLTHGLFKALLFLAAGSVIHATHDVQDMRRLGGLRAKMGTTFWTYLIGAGALAGIVPLAGFWSKDEILAAVAHSGNVIPFILLFLASLLTAFYMGRQVALIFFGQPRDPAVHAHESGPLLTVPLVILAVGSLIAGGLNLPFPQFGLSLLATWLNSLLPELPPTIDWVIAIFATAGAVGLSYVGWSFYTTRAAKVLSGKSDPIYRYSGDIWDSMAAAWYIDALYERTVVSWFRRLASFFAQVFDPQGIDGLVQGVAGIFGWGAGGVRRMQSGYVRVYALVFTLGVVVVLGYLVLR
ncbi:MAG: NADH-quinone oxidoreductase subunit L, partial [Oscillochloris sp.]|nr:NADH-quinone oxidoreductase subunit L [Oscillochloris sp.]